MTEPQTLAMLKIADLHVKHLQDALNDIKDDFPCDEKFIINMDKNTLRILDTMTGRFGKLQDLVGTRIIDLYLQNQSQPIEGLTIIDKVHKLEKLHIIENEDIWRELREVRNHIAHEYPDNPELAAQHLNNVYKLAPTLINIYQKLATAIKA